MMMRDPIELRSGVHVWHGLLDRAEQEALVDDIRDLVNAAPLFRPVTARGRPMSVRMTSAGDFGWVSDRAGYRYERRHPDGVPWPDTPPRVLETWRAVSGTTRAPQCCLVNFYDVDAKMGLHQDRDEADFAMPVVSISLGDDALFRVGGTTRGGKTQSVWLKSGDVAVLSGEGRLAYHGIDRIRAGSSTLLAKGGRINLTLRVVD
jgi:alkylated DNA repair protein (DNA oxidative demethylase)